MTEVRVEQGLLEGEQLQLVTGDGSYFSFKGIPYAQPPVGKLRFKAPQDPLPWSGVRKATEHGSLCPQLDIFTNEILSGSEDCLFLNVYTPDLKPKQPLPVMFFIHGGGFKSGSGDSDIYGPDFLVQRGVVLVTINYRLEALGFLCLDTEDVPGNAGLKDQVAAMRWVKKNIANFGGNPNNVTIFGESAGGALTALHVLSPLSKGLFRRAIPMSGVPLCDWSLPYEPRKRAFVLGKELGKFTNDPKELLEFLQSVPVEKLIDVKPAVLASEVLTNTVIKMYSFTPVVEKDLGIQHFLIESPAALLRKGKVNEVDVLIGHTSEESLVGVAHYGELLPLFDKFAEMFLPRELALKCLPDQCLELSDKIRQHYFGDKQVSWDTIREFLRYATHATFTYNVQRYASLLPVGKSKRYFYRFSCVSERNIYGNPGAEKYGVPGAAHFDDLMYLFDPKQANIAIDKSGKSFKMIQQMCDLFTNFAKYGNPTPDSSLGVVWPEYDKVTKMYVDIGENLTPGKNLDKDVVLFWDSIYKEAEEPNRRSSSE